MSLFLGQDLLIYFKRYQGSVELTAGVAVVSYNLKGSCTLKALWPKSKQEWGLQPELCHQCIQDHGLSPAVPWVTLHVKALPGRTQRADLHIPSTCKASLVFFSHPNPNRSSRPSSSPCFSTGNSMRSSAFTHLFLLWNLDLLSALVIYLPVTSLVWISCSI